jgi:3-deoxy-D-manno-oct-2-ulosonic acid (Kdo) hydroxylase
MSALVAFSHPRWDVPASADLAAHAAATLERGDVLLLSDLAFPVEPDAAPLFSPDILSSSKNASFDPALGRVGGTTLGAHDLDRLRRMMTRFSDLARALMHELFPQYRGRLERARSSFRPAEIAGRATSWRKDDTRLHIDSFPASPVQGRRILRVFTNVNPAGRPRTWRIGDDFDAVAARYAPTLQWPWPGSAALLHLLRVTKTLRTPYDALMLGLHDRMKEDGTYQRTARQTAVEFPAGTTWIAFTDQVSHAAMAGQYQLEQTFLLPVGAMIDERRSPLRILERLKGRRLA